MKARLLLRINALLVAFLGFLGFTSCIGMSKYGVPYAEIEASGTVTNTDAQPIENIQVKIKFQGLGALDKLYTDGEGKYLIEVSPIEKFDSIDLIATDTGDIYQPDSVRLPLNYITPKDRRKDEWFRGKATVEHNFQLKKK